MEQLNNKVFVVSGAGSGIGKALALALDKAGARLALNDVNPVTLAQTVNELSNSCVSMAFSVSEREQWAAFRALVVDAYGEVNAVINNAGIAHEAVAAEHIREEDFRKVMDINFYGVVYGTQVFLPDLAKAEQAALVNISSIFGVTAVGLQSAYCASKFAVRGYTESLRMEALNYYPNLLVSAVHPGGIKTNITESAIPAGSRTKEEREKDLTAFKQAFITSPEKAAQTIIDGINKKRTRILIGMDAKMLDYTARLMPASYSKPVLKQMKKLGIVDDTMMTPLEERDSKL